jgi:hypothetical protein
MCLYGSRIYWFKTAFNEFLEISRSFRQPAVVPAKYFFCEYSRFGWLTKGHAVKPGREVWGIKKLPQPFDVSNNCGSLIC